MGPWVKKGALDPHLDSQVNIVKTIEAILGLPSLSQWDQNAAVISGIWTQHPDFAPTKVLPMQVKVTFNPGKCADRLLLRREAGATGHILTPAWLEAHTDPHGRHLAPISRQNAYAPTSLLKVGGPEQMRQEWTASKGIKSYDRVMRYLQNYAKEHRGTVAYYQANEGN